jgi:hypothetical protein
VLQSLSQECLHHIHINVFEREEESSDCTSNDDDNAECEKTCPDKQLQFEDPNMQARYMYLKCNVYPDTCSSPAEMQIVMIDLFKVPMKGMKEELWVCVVKDHFTKFHWTKAFKGKDMGPIANFILEVFKETWYPSSYTVIMAASL